MSIKQIRTPEQIATDVENILRKYCKDSGEIEFDIFSMYWTGFGNFSVSFDISQLPGCCGVGVVYDLDINIPKSIKKITRNKLLKLITEFQMASTLQKGYSYMIQTDILKNTQYQDQMRVSKVKRLGFFKNSNSGNDVTVNGVALR